MGARGTLVRERIASPNFQSDPVQGWEIRADGSAVFSNVTIGSSMYTIGTEGDASFATVSVSGRDTNGDGILDRGFSIYGIEFLDYLNRLGAGAIAYGLRETSSGYSLSEAAFLQLDSPLEAGRTYRVRARGYAGNDTLNGRAMVTLRARYDGVAASETSLQMASARTPPMYAAGQVLPFDVERIIRPSTSAPHSFIITHSPDGGAGSSRIYATNVNPCEMLIEDLGLTVPDTGIDRTGGTPPPTKRNYLTYWTATSVYTHRGDGTLRTDTTDVIQGYQGSNGNQYSHCVFNGGAVAGDEIGVTLGTALTGATDVTIQAYLYAYHWYYYDGGTAILRGYYSTGDSGAPFGAYVTVPGWTRSSGQWVTVATSTACRGFSVGPGPSTDPQYYGRFVGVGGSPSGPVLRAYYTR